MGTSWETEEEDAGVQTALQPDTAASLTMRQLDTLGRQAVRAGYATKVYLALVDSDKHDWGIVEDTLSDLLWQPGKGEVVGTWSKPRYDSLVHISLGTALSVLQDRSVQTFVQYAEERRQRGLGAARPSKRARKAMEPVQKPIPDISLDEKMKFNSLRARLGRAK